MEPRPACSSWGISSSPLRRRCRRDRSAYLRVRAGNDKPMDAGPAGYETKDMGNKELRIVIKDNSIIIAGKRPWGSLYGVYIFFEEFIVIYYLTPNHTCISPVEKGSIADPVDISYSPVISLLRYSGYAHNSIHLDFWLPDVHQ